MQDVVSHFSESNAFVLQVKMEKECRNEKMNIMEQQSKIVTGAGVKESQNKDDAEVRNILNCS